MIQPTPTSPNGRTAGRWSVLLSLAVALSAGPVIAAAPLHERIDAALDAARVAPSPGLADDSSFLRRAFLDLAGRIPSADEARAFFADSTTGKRGRLIDRLLAGPDHARHMAITFDVTWVERRSDPHVKADVWREFLRARFETNAPYTALARDVILSDGADEKDKGGAKFLLARDAEPNALTRDVSRMFLGKDVQCAQCHNHPRIDDYTMREYYGVNAFLTRTHLFRPDTKKPGVVAENPTGEADYKSVFTQAEGRSKPRLPGGGEIAEPVVAKGGEYKVKPDKKNKKLRPIPTYSRRAALAELFAKGDNLQFRRNIVNRLWAHMMGCGIVEPVDFHHSDNPPTHPELLDLLANEFAAMQFDMRAFLRELALTRAYQRGFDLPNSLAPTVIGLEKRLTSLDADYEQLSDEASKAIVAFDRFKAAEEEKQTALAKVIGGRPKLEKQVAETDKARAAAKTTADAAAKPWNENNTRLQTLAEAAAKAKQAAENLKDDKELAQAAAVFEDRRVKLAAEVAKLKAGFDAKAALLKTAEQKASAAKLALDSANARAAKLAAELKGMDSLRLAEDNRRVKAKLAANFVMQRRDTVRELVAVARLESVDADARAKVRELEVAARTNKKTVDELAARQRELSAGLPVAQGELNLVLTERAAIADALQLAEADIAQIAADLGSANVGEPSKDGDRAEALLTWKRAREGELAGLRGRTDSTRAAFLQTVRELVNLKAAIVDNDARLIEARARGPKLAENLTAASKTAAASAEKLDLARIALGDTLGARFDVGGLTPLTPEQLCWSMLEATGETAKQAKAAEAEFAKKNPLKKGAKSTPAREAERAKFVEQYVYGKLKGQEANFVSLFGSAAGSPQNAFFATPDQALFFANGGNVRGWLNPSGGNLTDRLSRLEDPGAFAEELYLSALTRRPTPAEIADLKAELAARSGDRKAVAQELAWALLTSLEFRFRH